MVLAATCLLALAGGCPRERGGGDGGTVPDAATDAGVDAAEDAGPPYDPLVGNSFEGPLNLDDARVGDMDPSALPSATSPCREPVMARVSRVVDGDTVLVSGITASLDGPVRLIGVDTPEIAHDGMSAECWGDNARDFTNELVGRTVWLTFDDECTDRFDRLLAYVWVGPGPQDLWERQLLRRGHGTLLVVSPNDAHESTLAQDEYVARTEDAGLWSACR